MYAISFARDLPGTYDFRGLASAAQLSDSKGGQEMRHRAEIKPSRASSMVAAVVGLGMIALGVAFILGLRQAGGALAQSGVPVPQFISGMLNFGMLFVAVWLLAASGITMYHLVNIFRRQGAAAEVVDYHLPDESAGTASRLRELQQLRDEGLITTSEFDQKRAAILKRLG